MPCQSPGTTSTPHSLLVPRAARLPAAFFLFLSAISVPLWPTPARADGLWSDSDRSRNVAFWNAPGRLRNGLPPEAEKNGPWVVRHTPEGSRWFLAYQRALGAAGLPPTADAAAASPRTAPWEAWVQAKLDHDRWQAQAAADRSNTAGRCGCVGVWVYGCMGVGPVQSGTPTHPHTHTSTQPSAPLRPFCTLHFALFILHCPAPPPPGPIPPGLKEACGDAPPFAAAVRLARHTVTFPDGEAYHYTDNVALRPRYAYYRFPQGTVAYGPMLRDMPAAELETLFAEAGLTPSEARIARAVSRLEGGFETVNTYDTGFVSIGFIQFVTLENGRHSLSEVLMWQKVNRPEAFERDFRAYGIDVDVAGQIAVVGPDSGAELFGAAAVLKIVADRRLTALFQRAGRHSRPFRIAQVKVAKQHYWPADDPVSLTVDGREIAGKVSDVVRSEAGLATLYDRKVNRGTIDPFSGVLRTVMAARGLRALAAAAAYEREIVAALKYRADFLADPSLGQPPAVPKESPMPAAPDLPDFDALWDFRKPAETGQQFRALLPRAAAAGSPGYHAELLTQIARTEGLQRQFAEAHRTLDEAERLLTPDRCPEGRPRARARLLLERGRAFNSGGEPARSKPLFLEAWELARAAGEDNLAVDAAHMLGIVEPPGDQTAWSEKALELAEQSADPKAKRWLGPLYNNLGWSYHDLKQYDRALALFEKGLQWREAQQQPRETRIARWSVGRALRSLGRVEEALALQRRVLKEWEAAGEQDGYVHEELAECLLLLDQEPEARRHAALAHRQLAKDSWLKENEPARLQRLKELGGVQ